MIHAIRGTYDVLPSEIEIWHALEDRLRQTFHRYGFGEILTPIFEATDLYVRGVGEETDIVSKEMYTFTDRDETKSLTLRPEGTAPVMRAYIEHQLMNEARLMKLYYIAPCSGVSALRKAGTANTCKPAPKCFRVPTTRGLKRR